MFLETRNKKMGVLEIKTTKWKTEPKTHRRGDSILKVTWNLKTFL